MVVAVTWRVEGWVRRALAHSPHRRLPVGSLFQTHMSSWCEEVAGSHPPAFWWPEAEDIAEDIRRFVGACEACAQNKSSNQPPIGLLHPIPIPSRPCSHIALDFVNPSSGNTVILTVVDHFSKAVHFIPLPKLPSAREMARVVTDHIFHILPSSGGCGL